MKVFTQSNKSQIYYLLETVYMYLIALHIKRELHALDLVGVNARPSDILKQKKKVLENMLNL